MKFRIAVLLSLVFIQKGFGQFLLDSSFGFRGQKFVGVEGYSSSALTFQVLPDNRLISLITSLSGGGASLVLHRSKPNGAADSSFGINGYQPLGIYTQSLYALKGEIAIDTFKNIYTWGSHFNGSWIKRYDSSGIEDTGFNPLQKLRPYLGFYGINWFQLQKDGKYYVFGANNSIIRCFPDDKLDSVWAGDGCLETALAGVQGSFSSSDGRLHLYGKVPNSSNCAVMSLSKNGQKDLVRTFNGWILAPCVLLDNPVYNPFQVIGENNFGLYYPSMSAKSQSEINIKRLKDMTTAYPGFGKNGITTIAVDTIFYPETAKLLGLKNGNLLAFWNKYENVYDGDFNVIGIKNYCTLGTLMDSAGRPFSQFGKRGTGFLLPKSLNQYAIKQAVIMADNSIMVLMNIWNSGAYSAAYLKFKPLKVSIHNTTSSEEISKEPLSLNIYPNPSDGCFWVKGKDIRIICIMDNTGRLIEKVAVNPSDDEHKIIAPLKPGIYFIQAHGELGIFETSKLLTR
jgi:hypothetical protein